MSRPAGFVIAFALLASLPAASPLAQRDDSRSIVPEAFLNARPAGSASGDRPVYRPVGRGGAAGGGTPVELGVTLWRLRSPRPTDSMRLLVHQGAQSLELTPERLSLDARLASGDRLRITIESPRDGYLYVVDAEQYANGSTGQPYLIFPTKRTRGGDNKVTGGRIVDIPAQDDAPPYLTMRPSRADQVGERLTLIVVKEPIADLTIGPEPLAVDRQRVAAWEKRGSGGVQRFEMQSGAGKAWTAAERAASDGTRRLTREDPPPQTLLRISSPDPAFVAFPLQVFQQRSDRSQRRSTVR